jgi:hypothetical protein
MPIVALVCDTSSPARPRRDPDRGPRRTLHGLRPHQVRARIDVSLEESRVCVVDGEGRIMAEAKVTSEREALVVWLRDLGLVFERIGLEAGLLSQWLHGGQRAGLPSC